MSTSSNAMTTLAASRVVPGSNGVRRIAQPQWRTLRGMSSALLSEIHWGARIDGTAAVRLPAGVRRATVELPVVIFDGDDTLWATEGLYDDARRYAGEIVEREGLPFDDWWLEQIRIDVANTSRFGLRAERFPTSCVEAYEQIAASLSRPVQTALADEIWKRGASVFSAVAPLKEGVQIALEALRNGHRLVLLTQGDPRIQAKRVTDSGLTKLFDDIIVVEKKSTTVLLALLAEFNVSAERAWMVGNSIPSDVNPATAAGMHAIWIDAHVWKHERREALARERGVTVAASISDVPSAVVRTEERRD